MFIDRSDSEQINQIRQAVAARSDIAKIIELCQTVSLQVRDPQFPIAYAGILLASAHRIAEAISILKLCPGRTLTSY